MRVIEEISYPDFKLSVFYMNQKYLLKFEQGDLEQYYKFSEFDYIIRSHEDLKKYLSNNFLAQVAEVFKTMRGSMGKTFEPLAI